MTTSLKARIRHHIAKSRLYIRQRVRPGWRLPLGIVLILFGLLGFLPVLGFWMIPLGIAVAAMDLRKFRNGRNQLKKASKPDSSVAHSPPEERRIDHTGTR